MKLLIKLCKLYLMVLWNEIFDCIAAMLVSSAEMIVLLLTWLDENRKMNVKITIVVKYNKNNR